MSEKEILVYESWIREAERLACRQLAPSEIKRKRIVEKMDKRRLRLRNTVEMEESNKMLEIPKSVRHLKDFKVA